MPPNLRREEKGTIVCLLINSVSVGTTLLIEPTLNLSNGSFSTFSRAEAVLFSSPQHAWSLEHIAHSWALSVMTLQYLLGFGSVLNAPYFPIIVIWSPNLQTFFSQSQKGKQDICASGV